MKVLLYNASPARVVLNAQSNQSIAGAEPPGPNVGLSPSATSHAFT